MHAINPPKYNYDRTSAKRQAKRRALFAQMRDALRAVDGADDLDEAKAIARAGLREEKCGKPKIMIELCRY